MDLKVIIYAIPEHIEELTIKPLNQRCLRDNLCILVRRENSAMHRAQNMRKVPLTRRKHVDHVVEGH